MDKRAIKLREDLRALAANILYMVNYETTVEEMAAALKENQRLVNQLESRIDNHITKNSLVCSKYPYCGKCYEALPKLQNDVNLGGGYSLYTEFGPRTQITFGGLSACKFLEKLEQERLEAKVKEEFSKAMAERMGEELDDYINRRVTYLDPLTITKEEDKKLIEQLDERAKDRAKTLGLTGISPLRFAMGEIVKDHLMPPAPFIDRGKAE